MDPIKVVLIAPANAASATLTEAEEDRDTTPALG